MEETVKYRKFLNEASYKLNLFVDMIKQDAIS